MTQRQCPECGSELMLARRPDNQQRLGIVAIAPTYWRCSICGGMFTAEQLREWKHAKQLDNSTA
jgi:DNA-directed RNA polymerase subunit RPC12/RpoP